MQLANSGITRRTSTFTEILSRLLCNKPDLRLHSATAQPRACQIAGDPSEPSNPTQSIARTVSRTVYPNMERSFRAAKPNLNLNLSRTGTGIKVQTLAVGLQAKWRWRRPRLLLEIGPGPPKAPWAPKQTQGHGSAGAAGGSWKSLNDTHPSLLWRVHHKLSTGSVPTKNRIRIPPSPIVQPVLGTKPQ